MYLVQIIYSVHTVEAQKLTWTEILILWREEGKNKQTNNGNLQMFLLWQKLFWKKWQQC